MASARSEVRNRIFSRRRHIASRVGSCPLKLGFLARLHYLAELGAALCSSQGSAALRQIAGSGHLTDLCFTSTRASTGQHFVEPCLEPVERALDD